jgi:hypothetical protein
MTNSWQPNLTLSESNLQALQGEYTKKVNNIHYQEKVKYVIEDLIKKVQSTDKAFKAYDKMFAEQPPVSAVRFEEFEHGGRKITSNDADNKDWQLIQCLNEYQLHKNMSFYSFSTLTKLCVEQAVGKDKIKEIQGDLESAFKNTKEEGTYQDCMLNSNWSSLNIASTIRLPVLIDTLANILDTKVGDSEVQLARVKHALPLNIIMSQQLHEEDFNEIFAESQNQKELVKLFLKAMDDAFKISPEKYAIFASKNAFFEELLIKYSLNPEGKPAFKDIVTFLSSNKILSSFEDSKKGSSSALKSVYERTKGLINDTDYFEQDAFYKIGSASDQDFTQHSNSQSSQTAKSLCLWSRFFIQDLHNHTLTAKPNSEKNIDLYSSQYKQGTSPLKNLKMDVKKNIMIYDEGSGDEEFCIMEKVSQHLPRKEIGSKNFIAKSMKEDHTQMIKLLSEQSKNIDIKELAKQHIDIVEQKDAECFEDKFNKTFIQELQEPSIALKPNDNQSQERSKWLGDMMSQLGHSDQVLGKEEQELSGNVLENLNLEE